jgi:hypothetical protein
MALYSSLFRRKEVISSPHHPSSISDRLTSDTPCRSGVDLLSSSPLRNIRGSVMSLKSLDFIRVAIRDAHVARVPVVPRLDVVPHIRHRS